MYIEESYLFFIIFGRITPYTNDTQWYASFATALKIVYLSWFSSFYYTHSLFTYSACNRGMLHTMISMNHMSISSVWTTSRLLRPERERTYLSLLKKTISIMLKSESVYVENYRGNYSQV